MKYSLRSLMPKRSWFQFSLKTVFAVMTASIVVIGGRLEYLRRSAGWHEQQADRYVLSIQQSQDIPVAVIEDVVNSQDPFSMTAYGRGIPYSEYRANVVCPDVAVVLAWSREHLEAVRARREVLATERLYGEVRDRAVAEAERLRSTRGFWEQRYEEKIRRLPDSSAPAPNSPGP
jgi:hypothetical protein